MKRIHYITVALAGLVLLQACSDSFLDKPVKGALGGDVLANAKGIDALLTGAYAALDGQGEGETSLAHGGTYSSGWESPPDDWTYGSIAGGDAHKGSDGGDQTPIADIATFGAGAENGFFNSKWKAVYEGVARANAVLALLPEVTDVSDEEKVNIEAQARFLRGHYYFELKKMWGNVPWIDETTTDYNQPNNTDVWPKIEEDFAYAYKNLPPTQGGSVGRVNKWAAGAYLAKAYLYQKKYPEAIPVFTDVIDNGATTKGEKYDLVPFADNFNAAKKNNAESVFAIQMMANDGTLSLANANQGGMLNFPYGTGAPFACCGFFQPSQMLVNAFRTDADGLPLLDNANDKANVVLSDMGLKSSETFTPDAGRLDPRLDWTVGRRGLPYHDWGLFPGNDWVRDQAYAGPYAPKKNVHRQEGQEQYADYSSWAPGNAINVLIIRFADVLLMAAEAEAAGGSLDKAEAYVNRVRLRAADPAGWLHTYEDDSDPTAGFSDDPAANYVISPYPTGTFAAKGTAFAQKAIYHERNIELAMEGHRYFDLVRWELAEDALNKYLEYEGAITTDLPPSAKFKVPRNNHYPIPQFQIDLSVEGGKAKLEQNDGYN
jgi:starch-binding outer membrane protein, SusD/RagB family